MNEWQVQRFLNRRIIERRNELRRLQMEANNRDTLETNRFLGLTIIEVIAKNWWFQYEPKQIALINEPKIRFSDVKKGRASRRSNNRHELDFQYIVDLWREMHSITTKHEEIIHCKWSKSCSTLASRV